MSLGEMQPLVSCLMVTANRPTLAARAIWCFEQQTYSNVELVILDDGQADYRPIIDASPARDRIRYVKVRARADVTLGDLRSESIEAAAGDWMIQWDDDDWYHPNRIETQLSHALRTGRGASALRWTLMRVTTQSGEVLTYRADSGVATPGTILFRRTTVRYPSLTRNEDGVFLRDIRRSIGLAVLDKTHADLFVRVHHGSNTWDESHFLSKLGRTPWRWPAYARAKLVRGDLSSLSAFRLTVPELETIAALDAWRPAHADDLGVHSA